MRNSNLISCLIYALSLLAGPALAQAPPAKLSPPKAPLGSQLAPAPTWSSLTPSEQNALRPLSSKFDGLTAFQRLKWKEMAARFPTWSEEKRERVQSRMLTWSSMTPEQRGAARQEALTRQAASPPAGTKGTTSADSWRQWRDLGDEERDQLHKRAVAPAAVR